MTALHTRTDTDSDEHWGGEPVVLTTSISGCMTDDRELTDRIEDPITAAAGIEPLDPLAKDCPEDLPCRVQNGELWFADAPGDLERAKSFCEQCPARLACLSGALERREPWGVWGGEIFERGSIVARKRPRGRPRKNDRNDTVAA